jgi:predicted nucleic acid-binding protein
MPPRRLIYWDSCIFIAWIKDEPLPTEQRDGIAECVDGVEKGSLRLITSTITLTEVLTAKLADDIKTKYEQLMTRRSITMIVADRRVTALARGIREYYEDLRRTDGQGSLNQFDAIHLATAIQYHATAFYTLDDGGHGDRSLLSLNGNVAGHGLAITKPIPTQYRLGM